MPVAVRGAKLPWRSVNISTRLFTDITRGGRPSFDSRLEVSIERHPCGPPAGGAESQHDSKAAGDPSTAGGESLPSWPNGPFTPYEPVAQPLMCNGYCSRPLNDLSGCPPRSRPAPRRTHAPPQSQRAPTRTPTHSPHLLFSAPEPPAQSLSTPKHIQYSQPCTAPAPRVGHTAVGHHKRPSAAPVHAEGACATRCRRAWRFHACRQDERWPYCSCVCVVVS
jgi:hypothetical protein